MRLDWHRSLTLAENSTFSMARTSAAVECSTPCAGWQRGSLKILQVDREISSLRKQYLGRISGQGVGVAIDFPAPALYTPPPVNTLAICATIYHLYWNLVMPSWSLMQSHLQHFRSKTLECGKARKAVPEPQVCSGTKQGKLHFRIWSSCHFRVYATLIKIL